jgi:hypothetical protein
MAVTRLANLVQETVPAPGTGTVSLAGVVSSGFVAFTSQFLNGDSVFYALSDGVKTEIGEGTFSNSAGVATLVRTTVLWSSLGGTAKINFTASCRCWCAIPAERAAYLDDTLRLPFSTMPRPLQDVQKLLTAHTPSGTSTQALPMDTLSVSQLGFSGTLGQFTVSSAGWYALALSCKFQTTSATALLCSMTLQRYIGGGATATLIAGGQGGGAVPIMPGQTNIYWEGALTVNDIIKPAYAPSATSGATVGGDLSCLFSITKLSP